MKGRKEHQLIFHIGLHKTGTTFLQEEIFPLIKSVSLIRAWDTHRKILSSTPEIILISDEGISGNPYGGNYLKEFYTNMEMIKSIYQTSNIIIGIRQHSSLILSLYKQYLHQKGFKNIEYLYNKENTGIIQNEDLLFEKRIMVLKKLFDNVFVYSQESLKERPDDFLNQLQNFLNVKEKNLTIPININNKNVGVNTRLQVNFLRRLNKISQKSFLDLYSTKFHKYKMTPRIICQDYLKNFKSEPYQLPVELREYIDDTFREDWEFTLKHISY